MTANIWSPNPDTVTQANASGTVKLERISPSAGDRVLNISSFAYALGTGAIMVFKNGKALARNLDYVELSETSVIVTDPAVEGDVYLIQGFVGITATVGTDPTLRSDLLAGSGSNIIGFQQPDSGAAPSSAYAKLQEWKSVKDFFLAGEANWTAAINRGLAATDALFFPPGQYITDGGHVITSKCIFGVSREVSEIKASGVNVGKTLFVNDVTDVNSPGTWGSGKDFSIFDLKISGNWDAVSGLTSAGGASVGVIQSAYAPTQTALIKGVSAAYCFIERCYIQNAYEHGVLFYRTGYTNINNNIFARCRGSELWLEADSSAAAITSTNVTKNQFVAGRGGYGAVKTHYTYGVRIKENLFEDNTGWGLYTGEGADVTIADNYFEACTLGDAYLDPTLWGLSLIGNYWTIPPTLPSGVAARGFFSYDRKNGLHHLPVSGLGETDNRLGPVRYSSDSNVIGVATTVTATGTGLQFPATQDPSADPNTFDDYEEGTWTPGCNVIVVTGVTGTYTKKGREVTAHFHFIVPVNSDGNSFQVTGLPFPAASLGGVSLGIAGSATPYTLDTTTGNTYLRALNLPGTAFVPNSAFSGNEVKGTVVYHV